VLMMECHEKVKGRKMLIMSKRGMLIMSRRSKKGFN